MPGEEVPFIVTTSSSKSASLERPPSAQQQQQAASIRMPPVQAPMLAQDDLSLTQGIQPVMDEFIVASENLKRKNLMPPEGAISHADSEARQLAAEELAEALGLDNDVQLVSVISQPSGKSMVRSLTVSPFITHSFSPIS